MLSRLQMEEGIVAIQIEKILEMKKMDAMGVLN